jgi:glycerol uptake facilitator-like aquaporin
MNNNQYQRLTGVVIQELFGSILYLFLILLSSLFYKQSYFGIGAFYVCIFVYGVVTGGAISNPAITVGLWVSNIYSWVEMALRLLCQVCAAAIAIPLLEVLLLQPERVELLSGSQQEDGWVEGVGMFIVMIAVLMVPVLCTTTPQDGSRRHNVAVLMRPDIIATAAIGVISQYLSTYKGVCLPGSMHVYVCGSYECILLVYTLMEYFCNFRDVLEPHSTPRTAV